MPTPVAVRRRPLACEMPTVQSGVLLRRYRRDHDAADREKLVRRFMPLARRLARRYVCPSVGYDDLTQVASLALLKAIDRYDPDRGTSFRSYATPTILGEIKRYFRDCAWPIHLARSTKENALAANRASRELSANLGHAPSVRQIAEHLDFDESTALEALQAAQAFSAASLDEPPPSENSGEAPGEAGPEVEDERYELVENAVAIRETMPSLPSQEALILRLQFGRSLSQRQVGARLGVSQMQVSRLTRRALARLRALMDAPRATDHDSVGGIPVASASRAALPDRSPPI